MEERIKEVKKELEKSQIDVLLINTPVYLKYLTGFADFTDKSNALLIRQEETYFFIANRDKEEAREALEASEADVRIFPIEIWSSRPKTRSPWKDIKEANLINAEEKIGFEPSLEYQDVETLKHQFPNNQIVAIEDLAIGDLMAVKDAEEISLTRQAVRITDKVLTKVIGLVKLGMSESDLAVEVIYWHRKFGAEGDAFSPLIKSGPNSVSCHGGATSRKIQRGDILQFDIGGIYKNYCSDLSRVFIVGERPTLKQQEIYQIVLEANRRAIMTVRPGIACGELDVSARSFIQEKGYGDNFVHGIGHGVGLQIHDMPILARTGPLSERPLKIGSVITIEPGIYIPGWGGMRIEDMVLVTETGHEVLTSFPKDLLILDI